MPLRLVVSAFAAVGCLLSAGPAAADTQVTSNITSNTTWTTAGSPYVIDQQVSVKAGATLTIQPGVTVEFNGGQAVTLFVSGVLNASGNASSPIVFTSYQDASGQGAPGQYEGVNVQSGGSLQFSHVTMRYGGYGSGGYYAYGVLSVSTAASASVDHSTFTHNAYSGVYVFDGTANVSNSTFTGNGDGLSDLNGVLNVSGSTIENNTQDGVFFNNSSTSLTGSTLTANDITANGRHGIQLQQSCSSPLSTFPHGERNNIYNNGATPDSTDGGELYTLYTCHALPVDWNNNYWGSVGVDKLDYWPQGPCYIEVPSTYQPGGYVAYGSPVNWTSGSRPAPVSSWWYAASGPKTKSCSLPNPEYIYMYNSFLIGPGDFQTAYMPNHDPVPTSADLYGDGSRSADRGLEATPGLIKCSAGDPVDCATGNFYSSYEDLWIPGLNGGLSFVRTYNSQAAASAMSAGPLGWGWSFTFGETLTVDPVSGNAVVTGAEGNTVRFYANPDGSYWAPGWVQATLVKNGDGTYTYTLPDQRVMTFNGSGRLTSVKDRNGKTTTVSYNGSGQVTSVTDPGGRSLSFSYDSAGQVSQLTDPAGRTVKYAYDSSGDLTSVTDVGGAVTAYGYDSSHELTSTTERNGGTVSNGYDSGGRVVSQTDQLGRTTTWSYTSGETKITDPAGNVTDEQFASNLPTAITKGYGTASAATTTVSYDASENAVKITDPNGHAWQYGYDTAGDRTSVTDPLGHATSYTFDARRDVTSVTLPSGRETNLGYDQDGNLTSITRTLTETGQNAVQTLAYDARGDLTSTTDPLNRTWAYGYDSYGDLTSATSPAGNETTWSYDVIGNQTSVTSARGNAVGGNPSAYTTSTAYNAYGLPTTVTDPAGNKTTMSYDADQNLTDNTDRDGRHTQIAYDAANEPVKVTRPDGTVLKTSYGPDGQVAAQTDGLAHTTSYSYDPLGRVVSVTDPLGRAQTFSYDAAGNRTSLRNPSGQTTTFRYDAANELTSVSYSSANPGPVTFTYTADGQRARMNDQTGTASYSYDSLGRLTSQTSGAGQTTSYGYDLDGELTSVGYPAALTPLNLAGSGTQQQIPEGTVTRTYDPDGNLASVSDWLGNKTTFGYDPEDHLTSVARPNGTHASYGYDANGAIASLNDLGQNTSYGRSNEGLLTSTTPAGQSSQAFGYDGAQRLTSAGADSYQYDSADNLTQTNTPSGQAVPQTFDTANELASATQGTASTTFGYDSNGNRVNSTPSSGPQSTYSYDQANQLIAYNGPDHTSTTGATVSDQYTYDGDGLRQTKTSNNILTNETYDLSGTLPTMTEDGPAAYIYGPGDLPIEQIGQTGTVLYYSNDQLGSTTALTDQTGNTAATYTYDAYGNPTTPAASGITNPFGYAGQHTDPQTGLEYDRARYYDPTTGQFLSRDPLNALTREAYTYAAESPPNATDPTGLDWSLGPISIPGPSPADVGGTLGGILDTAGSVIGSGATWAWDHPGDAGGLVLGAVSIGTGFGALADLYFVVGETEVTATGLGVASAVSGAGASGIDTVKCAQSPSVTGCAAAVAGWVGGGLGIGSLLTGTDRVAAILGAEGASSGGLALALDLCPALDGP